MRGFPKNIATRQDLENLLTMPEHAGQVKAELQRLVEGRFAWGAVGPLEKGEAGKTEASHKVVSEDVGGQAVQQQWELVEDPQAPLFRLGLNVSEVEGLVAAPRGDAEKIS